MRGFKNAGMAKFLLNHKYYLLALLMLVVVAFVVLTIPTNIPEEQKNPPVVSQPEELTVVSVNPVGDFQSLDLSHPIAIEFNKAVGPDVSKFRITITPSIAFEKYTLTARPNVLWLRPTWKPNQEEEGWHDGVEYTVTIEKGSESPDGAVLNKPYIFKFRNSPSGAYMRSK